MDKDWRKLSLADFYDVPDVDLFGRAEKFSAWVGTRRENEHLSYRRISTSGSAPVMRVVDPYSGEEREMIYLGSNDYLNLTRHPRTIAAGRAALDKYGAGAGSVPLLGGTLDLHVELEETLARFKGCESAIIFTSGFGSNSGALMAMLGQHDCAILDLYVHASIVDGCKNAKTEFFRHNDMRSLERVLVQTHGKYRTRLVIVDGVYSMDGDIAPLDKICELAHAHGAYVMVDEAHATGVIGDHGRGTPEHFHIEGKVDIVAGTMSKALGGVGGFIAARTELIELLHYFSRSYMFSTAMPPQVAGSVLEGLRVIEDEPELRERLWANIRHFRDGVKTLGFNTGNAETAIFPLIIGDDWKVDEICRRMQKANIYVNPVLYPAVSKRLSRLRISLMATHTREHLDYTLNVLEDLGREFGVIGGGRNAAAVAGS